MLLAATEIAAAPVVIFMGLGVIVAIVGHMAKSASLVLGGLFIVFLATAAMFVGAYAAYQNDEVDPRPPCGETVKECEKDSP
jgi:membrane protein implicated in regulation of membrane protease activity